MAIQLVQRNQSTPLERLVAPATFEAAHWAQHPMPGTDTTNTKAGNHVGVTPVITLTV